MPRGGRGLAISTSLLAGLDELTEIHDVVPADGTIVYDNIPSPQRNRIPLEKESASIESTVWYWWGDVPS